MIDFPTSPATNDQLTVGSKTWQFDGVRWARIGDVAAPAPAPAPSLVSARWWRVVGVGDSWETNMGVHMFQAAEIQMFASTDCTGTNLCIGGVASASDTTQGSPSNINDGNTSGTFYWASTGTTPERWWGVDMATAAEVRSLRFWPREPYGVYAPRTAKLQASDDGVTWADVGAVFDFGQNTGTYSTTVLDIQ